MFTQNYFMRSDFENKYFAFLMDDVALEKVSRIVTGFTKSRTSASELIDEVGISLLDKDADGRLPTIKNFVNYFITVAKNKYVDKCRRDEKNNPIDVNERFYKFRRNSNHKQEDIIDLESRKIIETNQEYILNNIEKYIFDDFKRRIFLARNDLSNRKQLSYEAIAIQLKNEGITQANGFVYELDHLRQIYNRAHKELLKLIDKKYPYFTTKLITGNNE